MKCSVYLMRISCVLYIVQLILCAIYTLCHMLMMCSYPILDMYTYTVLRKHTVYHPHIRCLVYSACTVMCAHAVYHIYAHNDALHLPIHNTILYTYYTLYRTMTTTSGLARTLPKKRTAATSKAAP